MTNALTDVFDAVYRGESPFGARPPWVIGGPQPAVVDVVRAGLVRGAVLDPGCGTGDHALYLAAQGHPVTGIDLAPTAVAIARRRAAERGLDAFFEVGDALELAGRDGRFDTVVDVGLAHAFGPDELRRYAAGLHRVCRPGAVLHVLEISDRGAAEMQARLAAAIPQIPAELPADVPPRSADDLPAGFAAGWTLEARTDATMQALLAGAAEPFGTHAWLARLRRDGTEA